MSTIEWAIPSRSMVASAIASCRRRGDQQQGRRPQHDADTEVRGDPPRNASTSAARPPTSPPTPSIVCNRPTPASLELEELERNRDGEHDRRAGDDRLQAVQRCDERQLASSQDRPEPCRHLVEHPLGSAAFAAGRRIVRRRWNREEHGSRPQERDGVDEVDLLDRRHRQQDRRDRRSDDEADAVDRCGDRRWRP